MQDDLEIVKVERLIKSGYNSHMKSVSISETKNRLSALIDEVKAGEVVLITDRGRPVARLVAASAEVGSPGRIERLERDGVLSRGSGRAVLEGQPPDIGGSALDALLRERLEGR
jgi:prevent-host-death family protein